MRLGPDTAESIVDLSYRHFSGYNYLDNQIRGFSHTHLVGAGVNDLGTIGIMPFNAGKLQGGRPQHNGWWSTFNKSSEYASPGYYKVHLDEPNADAELLSVGTYAGIHRYTYKHGDAENVADGLILDVCHAAKLEIKDSPCLNASVSFDSKNPHIFRASVFFAGGLSGQRWYHLYGEISTSNPAVSLTHWTTCTDPHLLGSCSSEASSSSTSGTLFSVGNFVHPRKSSEDFTLEIRVGLSRISMDLAEQNLRDAIPNKLVSFSDLKARTEAVWCDHLQGLEVEVLDGDNDLLTILQSSYYRTFISVSDYTEHDGLYLAMDQSVRNITAERESVYPSTKDTKVSGQSSYLGRFFSELSLWDTFRTLQPWMLLTNENLAIGVARSMGDITVQQQSFPRWTLGNHEASCMIGESGTSFILDVALSGFQDQVNFEAIQKIFAEQSTQPWPLNGRDDLDHYLAEGFVSQETSDTATSLTLTFAYDDYVLAKMSELVNDTATATSAMQRSYNYRTIWSPEKQFFCPRYSTGEMKCAKTGSSPETWSTYREGDANHWAWFVPHDVDGLKALYPSPEAFDASLETFMVNHVPFHNKFGSAAPNPYYWAGNEHDFLAPYMFNFGPDCTNTQYWTRELTKMHFSNTPHGIPGNDDYGSMATWVLFSSLGLFPQAGLNRFLLTSPRVKAATVVLKKLNSNRPSKLVIKTYNNSDSNVFVQKLLVNGQEWTSPIIDRNVLVAKDIVTLEFYMQSTKASGLCAKAV